MQLIRVSRLNYILFLRRGTTDGRGKFKVSLGQLMAPIRIFASLNEQ
jgi:hypothetical protein